MMRIKMQTFFMLKYAMSYFYVNISFKIVYIFFLQGEKKWITSIMFNKSLFLKCLLPYFNSFDYSQ